MFIPLLFISWYFFNHVHKLLSKNVAEAKYDNDNKKYRDTFLKLEKALYKRDRTKSFLKRKELKLQQRGNPLNLTPITYYLLKFIPVIIAVIIDIFSRTNILISAIVIIILYFDIDIYYYLNNKDDNNKILIDLPDIIDLLDIQYAAGADLGIALTELYDVARNKRLKKALLELAAEINLTKVPSDALDRFVSKFQLSEINSFALSIKQALTTGRIKDVLSNQSMILKQNNLFTVQEHTKKIETNIGIIAIFLFLGIVLFVIYSFGNQLGQSINGIFK